MHTFVASEKERPILTHAVEDRYIQLGETFPEDGALFRARGAKKPPISACQYSISVTNLLTVKK